MVGCVRDFPKKKRVHEVWVGNLMTPESDSHRKKETQKTLPPPLKKNATIM